MGINRGTVLDLINDVHNAGGFSDYNSYSYLFDQVDTMPESKTDAEPHWIPVTERMPEEHEWLGTKRFGTTKSDEVYVTFENPKGERFCNHLSFQNGKLSAFDQSTIDAFFKGSRPVAWKPMPEPFKGVAE